MYRQRHPQMKEQNPISIHKIYLLDMPIRNVLKIIRARNTPPSAPTEKKPAFYTLNASTPPANPANTVIIIAAQFMLLELSDCKTASKIIYYFFNKITLFNVMPKDNYKRKEES